MKRPLQTWKKDYLELSGFEVEIENRGDVGLETRTGDGLRSLYPGSDAAGDGWFRDLQGDSQS